jgi:hypothetical protein
MSVPEGFVLLVEAEFKDGKQNPLNKVLLKTHNSWALMVERTLIQTPEVRRPPAEIIRAHFPNQPRQRLQARLKSRFDLSTTPNLVAVSYNSGCGTGGSVVLSKDSSWEKIIANYDHVYIVILSGRAKGQDSRPGTSDTKYNLRLSKGPWPLMEGSV